MLRCRKNQATLTATEKSRFVAAVLALKANGTYDRYVDDHVNFMASAHRGPAFFPWHREYLRRLELDLQAIDSTVTLPYWNWTVDNSPASSIWGADFMGGNGRPTDGQVLDGPFAFSAGNWTLVSDGPFLRRRFGVSVSTLPTPTDLANALATVPYDVPPYNDGPFLAGFRNTLEGWRNGPQLHNRVHVWVGGSMGPSSSPNDPVFFLHHCFIDKLWADWQALHPAESYVPTTGAAAGHNLTNPMEPWASRGTVVTPASVLDHHTLGYAYDTEAVCRPKFKFLDDTSKFRDDKRKFFDDPPKFKFTDDVATRKFIDDPKRKIIDDPKTKFLDDPGTLKAVDDVKGAGFDNPLDPLGGGVRPAPFILSTPHHTMAWSTTFPGALQSALSQLEEQLREQHAQIARMEDAEAKGGLSAAEKQQLELLRQEFAALLAEHDALSRGTAPGCG